MRNDTKHHETALRAWIETGILARFVAAKRTYVRTFQSLAFCMTIIGGSSIGGSIAYPQGVSLEGQDVQVETYTISGASYDRKHAILQLGPPNFFRQKTCPRKFQRMRCQHSWAKRFEDDAGCGYPSDTFEADTTADWKVGSTTNAEQARKAGWYTLNALKCGQQQSDPGHLGIGQWFPSVLLISASGQDIEWEPGQLNAPYAYKKISGDFQVFTEALIYDYWVGFYAGLLCQSVEDLTSWVYFGRAVDQNLDKWIRATAAEAGSLKIALEFQTATHSWLYLTRNGNDFACYYSLDALTWTLLGTQTVPMSAPVRLGFCLSAPRIERGMVSAGFSIFQFRAGGDSTCERTREACRLKGNIHRYGAFPGIPTRR